MRHVPTMTPTTPAVRTFFAFVVMVFTCVYPYLSWINNPNENVRTYMTMAIVEEHTFKIDSIVKRYGWVNDMAAVPQPGGAHQMYSVKAPAVSYAGVPVYWAMTKIAPRLGYPVATDTTPVPQARAWFQAATILLRLFTIQIPCFLFLVWLERWLRTTSPDPVLRLSAVAAVGLGSNYLAYSLMFASHAPFAIAAFASFALTTRERALFPDAPAERRLSRAFLAGLFAGLATLLEYHAAPLSLCLAAYALTAFWRPTRYATFSLGAALSAVALGYFQWRAFKSPFTPGHKMIANPAFVSHHAHGFYGIAKPSWTVWKSISFNLGYGFFGTSPFMWLGLLAIPCVLWVRYGTRRAQQQRRTATLGWVLMMLALWTTVSGVFDWHGGWSIGPRYLGAAPPFFAYGALCALEGVAVRSAMHRAVVRGVAGGALLASVLTIGIVGLHFNTIPQDITRPFVQFTWPMMLAGFVPHHALELVGVKSPALWYVVAGCLLAAAGVAALAPWRERRWTWPVRAVVCAAVFALAMLPALSTPSRDEPGDFGQGARGWFTRDWQPAGRDRVTSLRREADKNGPRRRCARFHLSRLERLVGMRKDAARDEGKSAGADQICRDLVDRLEGIVEPPARLLERTVHEGPKKPEPGDPAEEPAGT
jgi:hypothetical protein